MNTYEVNKNQIGEKIGYIIEKEEDFFDEEFPYIVRGFADGTEPILMKSKIPQHQWNLMTEGKLSKKDSEKYF